MKAKLTLTAICYLLSALCVPAFAQGTAFTYQGRLDSGGAPANGSYDLAFSLYAADSGGVPIAGPVTNFAVTVSNGLFSTLVDFGSAFTGASNWLHIAVSTNGANAFSPLSPRQQLTPVPYAIAAGSAGTLLGTLPAAQVSGTLQSGNLPASPNFTGTVTAATFCGSGANVTNVNAAALNGLTAARLWQLGGNSVAGGQFLGSTNNQPVELWVNGNRALRLEPGFGLYGRAPNVIGGASPNYAAANIQGATIAGGGAESFWGGPATNSVTADYGTVGGGFNNASSGNQATVGGGHVNVASADSATVGGGYLNTASGPVSVVPGGQYNVAAGLGAFAAGQHAQALHQGSFVWADSQSGNFASSANDQFLIRAQGGVGIGKTNPATALDVNGTVTATSFRGNLMAPGTVVAGMAYIPAGSFTMGNSIGDSDVTDATPTNVYVSAFYMDVNLVSLSQWQSVYYWATANGYNFAGSGFGNAANHPVYDVNWYSCVKWCNARSQQAGLTPVYYTDAGLTSVFKTNQVTPFASWSANGYRLPTEAEWEKAARGGLAGLRFPWGNLITENLANYYASTTNYNYDLGPDGYNAAFSNGPFPYSSPVGTFAANGYGLYDMAGDVSEWCWDWYGMPYAGGSEPHGPAAGSYRVVRGGSSESFASYARCANRDENNPGIGNVYTGFRCVRGL